MDEPIDDKYTDNDLLDLIIPPAVQEVWGWLHNSSDNPIVASFSLTVTTGTKEYLLPPSVQNVHNLVRLDDEENWVYEHRPRGKHHARGPNWFLEGNILRFDPKPRRDETLVVFYTPTPDQPMHHAPDGTLDAGKTVITLSTDPSVGYVDKRVNGYIGAVVRIYHPTKGVETRIISAHDVEAGTITVRMAFVNNDAGTVAYEIFPPGSAAFLEAIALAAVLKLGAQRGVSQARMKLLMDQFRQARRTEAQRLENMMSRRGKSVEKATVDNDLLGLANQFGAWWVP
jgi:hypothetical protein